MMHTRRLSTVTIVGLLLLALTAAQATGLTVMSFDIWGGGANEDKPVDETVAAIRAAGADIVGMQETQSDPATPTIARLQQK